MTKHTPLPWKSQAMGSEGARIFPDTGDKAEDLRYIAIVSGKGTLVDIANAEFMTRACNSHYELLAALKAVLNDYSGNASVAMCRAAIAKAETP